MPDNPNFMSDRPVNQDPEVDVVGEILGAIHLTTAVYGRIELGSPWRLRIPARPYLSFYVVARGGGWIEVDYPESAPEHPGPRALPLSAGDAVLLPRGTAHTLGESAESRAKPLDLDYGACPRPWIGEAARFGGEGPVTSLVTGHFTFSGNGSRNRLLETLPPVIHLPAGAAAEHPQLAGVVPLILNESARPGPGAGIVLARLADLLLVHALRFWMTTSGKEQCGLRAVADPNIGAALRLMHARAAEGWTVEGLADAVAMSRSAFAARFTKLVGEPPLQYLARWRMTQASRMLSTSDQSVTTIAEQVGYANPVAFAKAFARYQGVGPGAYRRAQTATRHLVAQGHHGG